jgi:hypothetical protein
MEAENNISSKETVQQTEITVPDSSEMQKIEPEPQSNASELSEEQPETASEEEEQMQICITVGNEKLSAIPEDNSSAEAFIELLRESPMTIKMSDYAGMEKVGSLETSLPKNDTQMDVSPGDVILYQGNQITIYYGTNSWSLTKLAVIQDITGDKLLNMLGAGDVEVTFSIEE